MGNLLWVAAVCAALSRYVTSYPYENDCYPQIGDHLKWPATNMKFNWKWTNKGDRFSVQGTTYFSKKWEAYRFDVFGGMDSLYVYPRVGLAYYFFPATDFTTDQLVNTTRCKKIELRRINELPSPLPSTDDYAFSKSNSEGNLIYTNNKGLEKIIVDDTGPFSYPIFYEDPRKIVTYDDFSFNERDWWFLDRSTSGCSTLEQRDYQQIYDYADIARAPWKIRSLFETKSESKRNSQYRTGAKPISNMLRNFVGGLERPFPYTEEEVERMAEDLPKSFDWRDFGAVTPVKNQRQCGSCWAFGTIAALEGAYKLKHGELVNMSEQALIDCDWNGNRGCFGGDQVMAYEFIRKMGGIPRDDDYSPYQEVNGYCRIDVSDRTNLVAPVKGYYKIPEGHAALKVALVKLGPVLVTIQGEILGNLERGRRVINNCNYNRNKLDHDVLLVGYDETKNSEPHWILKNSWGANWGDNGYFYMTAMPNVNCLGIWDSASVPIIE